MVVKEKGALGIAERWTGLLLRSNVNEILFQESSRFFCLVIFMRNSFTYSASTLDIIFALRDDGFLIRMQHSLHQCRVWRHFNVFGTENCSKLNRQK